ncbi:hypothetical protein HMPREF1548_02558 [Clostridium sp. KLE 1755]|nr:hypothetical protein HMPREF1548_02558 [Clostridium sp. KLE 1755]
MDMETWFAPAIEMGRLVRQYRIAQEDEKEELERRIQNSAYISRLNTMQSFNSVDFLRGIVEEDAGGGKAEGEGERKLRQPGQQPFRLQAGPVYTGRIFPERREMQTHRPEPPSVMALCGLCHAGADTAPGCAASAPGAGLQCGSHQPLSPVQAFPGCLRRAGTAGNGGDSGLAARYNREISGLIGMVIKSAGGWGETENNLVLEGWLGDRIVCRKEVGESRYAAGITARADDTVLYADGDTYDATRITVKAVDNMGNLLPFTQECVEIRLDGPARLLGPARFPLTGGVSSFWIRTVGKTGTVRIGVLGVESKAECTVDVK